MSFMSKYLNHTHQTRTAFLVAVLSLPYLDMFITRPYSTVIDLSVTLSIKKTLSSTQLVSMRAHTHMHTRL